MHNEKRESTFSKHIIIRQRCRKQWITCLKQWRKLDHVFDPGLDPKVPTKSIYLLLVDK